MTAPPPDAQPPVPVYRTADLQLRGRSGPLPARVYWPGPDAGPAPALLVFLHTDRLLPGDAESADALCRRLCSRAGVVVLSASCRPSPACPLAEALEDATTATHWAADHAAELDADPGRLLVGGEGPGAHLAAAVALRARDDRWPTIARQLVIRPAADAADAPHPAGGPVLDAGPSLAGVAPATVVPSGGDDAGGEDGGGEDGGGEDGGGEDGGVGGRYAARLRRAGVEVDELPGDLDDDLAGLAQALRRRLRQRGPDRRG